MNTRFRALLLFLIILLSTIACTANQTRQKQQRQATAYRELAEAYLAEGQYTPALQELLKAEKLRPDSALIHNDLGLVYMVKDRMDLAVQQFKQALAIKPDYAEATNNLATALLRQGEWDEAIIYLDQLINSMVYATPQYALLNLGSAHFHKKDYTRAEKYYRLTIKHYDDGFSKDSTYAMALGGLGRTYIATGRLAEALTFLGKAAKWGPTIPDTYYYMGQAYEKAGQLKDAKMAYLKVIDVAPNSEIADQAARAALKLK